MAGHLFCERMTGQWEKKTRTQRVKTPAVDSCLWQGQLAPGPWPVFRPAPAYWPVPELAFTCPSKNTVWKGLWGLHSASQKKQFGAFQWQFGICLFKIRNSQISAMYAKKSSQKIYYKREQWQNINLYLNIYIIFKICYSFNLWTEISCLFFFFFSVFFASLICIFTWSCNLEKNAWDDFKALSLPSSCN